MSKYRQLKSFYRYYFGRYSSKLAKLVSLPYSRGRSTHYSVRLHDISVNIPRCYKDVYVNSFFLWAARPWNSWPKECFPLTFDLKGFKSRINRHLLSVGYALCTFLLYTSFSFNSISLSGCSTLYGVNPIKEEERKSVVAERSIRTFKNKICKYMTSIWKNVYIDKLDIVSKYNNMYRTIKIKSADVKTNTYIDFNVENNNEHLKFEVGRHVRISKYKIFFAKGYTPNCSEEKSWKSHKTVKNTVPRTSVREDLNGEKTVGIFYEKELQKTNQTEFRIQKVIRGEKVIHYMFSGKAMILCLIAG